MLKILHFADAHIDMVNFGRHDRESGLPVRVTDFLNALDQIIDRALAEKVDLVIFAGDAYRNQRPHPRFQREWQLRIGRLSRAKIPTILLVGNHDTSPAAAYGHALQEFATLNVPYVHVADRFKLYTPDDLGIPVQVLAMPWVSDSTLMTRAEYLNLAASELANTLEEQVVQVLDRLLDSAESTLPLIMTAHATVSGATYGSERQVLLGRDLVLTGSTVKDPRLDYVAMGHIHKHQTIGVGHPPVIYPGSIERVDFGEYRETKGFILAEVNKGKTTWEFVPLNTRKFWSDAVTIESADNFMAQIMDGLPEPSTLSGVICRLELTYPREMEALLDENELGKHFKHALSFQVSKKRTNSKRSRLGDTLDIEALSKDELLSKYWQTLDMSPEQTGEMQALAKEVFGTLLYGEK